MVETSINSYTKLYILMVDTSIFIINYILMIDTSIFIINYIY